jgi:hypothetical protein
VSVPVPVVMLMRCIVVAGAAPVKQSAREKNESQSALSGERFPSRELGRAFSLRAKNVFMHITIERAIDQDPPRTFLQE